MQIIKTFRDQQFRPPAIWRVAITAHCPRCDQQMKLGKSEGGGTLVMCPKCGFGGTYPEMPLDEVARAVLRRMEGPPGTPPPPPGPDRPRVP